MGSFLAFRNPVTAGSVEFLVHEEEVHQCTKPSSRPDCGLQSRSNGRAYAVTQCYLYNVALGNSAALEHSGRALVTKQNKSGRR